MKWRLLARADYLSSSRKRLAPQMIYKGGIFQQWGKRQAVALHKGFFATLPELPEIEVEQADIAWLVYDLQFDAANNRYQLVLDRVVYTAFEAALLRITTAPAGSVSDFMTLLQTKLDTQLGHKPDAPSLQDMLGGSDQ